MRRARRRHGLHRPASLPALKDLRGIERPPELGDGRLRLRALREDDRRALVAALNDELAGRFLFAPPFPYTDADFDEYLATCPHLWPQQRQAVWVIEERGQVLGTISLNLLPLRQTGEIGYQLGPWARGRGVCRTAAALVRDWGLDGLELERLEIAADIENIASQRVAQALGMRHEGSLRDYLTARGQRRDYELFAMCRADPRAPRFPLPRPELGDGRLRVRLLEPDDAPAVADAFRDDTLRHWLFGPPEPYGLEDAQAFIRTARRDFVRGTAAHCAIRDEADGRLLGAVGLHVYPERQAAEIGYWVRREERRRGVMLAAARLLVGWGFGNAGVERMELQAYPGNSASQALAARLGFVREGLLRGVLPVEAGKGRDGRYDAAAARAAGLPAGAPPPRDDQVLFSLQKEAWTA